MTQELANRLTFETVPPEWALAVLVVLWAAVVWFGVVGTRRVRSRGLRALMVLLRAVAAAAVALAILGPGFERTRSVLTRNVVAVLVDTSRSMTLPYDVTGAERFGLVRDYVKAHEADFAQLDKDFEVRWYTFGDKLADTSRAAVPTLQPAADKTDFAGALQALSRRLEGRPVRAVLLFSDGADTETPAPATDETRKPLVAAASRIAAPFHCFAAGSDTPVRDVSITDVKASRVAFTRRPWPLSLRLEARGYPAGTSLPVALRIGGKLISTRTVRTRSGQYRYEAEFNWTPTHTGRAVCTLAVAPRPDEVIRENNFWAFTVNVVRDKIRVLHVAGAPSWDVRFLRRTLKRDPSVDLVSFFILRTRTDPVAPRSPGAEINLIPFPVNELFTDALPGFDVIIFQNFDYRPYEIPGYMTFSLYLRNIRRQVVENGAGFVMVGGDESFGRGGYRGTPLEDVLPVRVGGLREEIDTGTFKAVPTEAAVRHPITSVGSGAEETRRLWLRMPELAGSHVIAPADRAVTLLVRPDRKLGGTPVPIVAVADAGKGRSLAITTDETWRWNFVAAGEDVGNLVYLRFWRNAIRWLVHDPIGQRLKIDVDKPDYAPGENVVAQLEAFTHYYSPRAGAPYTLSLLELSSDRAVATRRLRTDGEGRIVASFGGLPQGSYVLRATADEDGTEAPDASSQSAETCFNVADRSREFRRVQVDLHLLSRLAENTRGTVSTLSGKGAAGFPTQIPNPRISQPIERLFYPLWSTWGWLAVIAVSLSIEWWLRRWYGIS